VSTVIEFLTTSAIKGHPFGTTVTKILWISARPFLLIKSAIAGICLMKAAISRLS